MNSENNRLCEGCKFYTRYYVKRSSRLKYAGRGCCVYCAIGTRKYNQIPRIDRCDDFSPAEQTPRHCDNMKRVLCDMAKSLSEIALMLGADEREEEV